MKGTEKKKVMDALDQFVDKVLAYNPTKKKKRPSKDQKSKQTEK